MGSGSENVKRTGDGGTKSHRETRTGGKEKRE